jgi:tRNA(Ile)-lysidine synthase
MNHSLKHSVTHFLNAHLDPDKPILLGFSGGPDSLALLHLLIEYKQQKPLQLALAHVDHGWREESSAEAQQLHTLAVQLQLPFHLKTLNPETLLGNLEAACREERLNFFKELAERHQYQAVMLAHHADDQAETVLKRVFEGADLSCMGGLKEKSEIYGLPVWRPLLNISKNTIVTWLEQRGHIAITDKTNLDAKFLRGRCRTQILPYLAETFGKEISGNLCHLGAEVQELTRYLASRIAPFLTRVEVGGMGTFLDLSHDWPQEPVELKYLLRQLMRQEGITPSREAVETACRLITSGQSDRHITVGKSTIHIDRKRIFIEHQRGVESLPPRFLLQEGAYHYGPWQLTVVMKEKSETCQFLGWKSAWNGGVEVFLPVDAYHLGPAVMHAPYPGNQSSISKWWTNDKIPAFLRHRVPVIWRGDHIYHEFLTHRSVSQKFEENYLPTHWMQISLKYN